jgi:hypothetical protein
MPSPSVALRDVGAHARSNVSDLMMYAKMEDVHNVHQWVDNLPDFAAECSHCRAYVVNPNDALHFGIRKGWIWGHMT